MRILRWDGYINAVTTLDEHKVDEAKYRKKFKAYKEAYPYFVYDSIYFCNLKI
jgi:hypothetical protein